METSPGEGGLDGFGVVRRGEEGTEGWAECVSGAGLRVEGRECEEAGNLCRVDAWAGAVVYTSNRTFNRDPCQEDALRKGGITRGTS